MIIGHITRKGSSIINSLSEQPNKTVRGFIATGDYSNIKTGIHYNIVDEKAVSAMRVNSNGDVFLKYFPERLSKSVRSLYNSIAFVYEKLAEKTSGIKVNKEAASVSISVKNSLLDKNSKKFLTWLSVFADKTHGVATPRIAKSNITEFSNRHIKTCAQQMYNEMLQGRARPLPVSYLLKDGKLARIKKFFFF